MGIHADLVASDLDGINPDETARHLAAVALLSPQQLSGMLGWAQQNQQALVYNIAYALLYDANGTPRQPELSTPLPVRW